MKSHLVHPHRRLLLAITLLTALSFILLCLDQPYFASMLVTVALCLAMIPLINPKT
jgi:hypothetical protein